MVEDQFSSVNKIEKAKCIVWADKHIFNSLFLSWLLLEWRGTVDILIWHPEIGIKSLVSSNTTY